jgi:hypothetical protein
MRRRVSIVSLAGLAAGLVAATLPGGGSASAAGFLTPVVVSGTDASEPGIDVDKTDGTLYINAPVGIGSQLPFSPSLVWRSKDAGATWTPMPASLRAFAPGGGDSDISVAPDSTLSWTDLWLGSSTVASSNDQAMSWLANPVQGTFVQDRQWVAGVGGKVVYHVTHQIPTGITVGRSVDGGVTYPYQMIAATPLDQTGCVCPPGMLIAEAGTPIVAGQQATSVSDKVGVAYSTSSGGVKFARSVNSGLTYTQATIKPAGSTSTIEAFPIVANAGGNKLVAVWMEVSGSRSTVGFASSTDWGATWSAPKTIVSTGTAVYPWVDAHNDKVAVSLYYTTATGTPSNVPSSAQWFESYLESLNFGGTWSPIATADPTAVKSGPICTDGINCSADRELGDFQSIVLDGLDRPNLAYVRSINGASNTEVRFVRQ